MTAAEPVLRQRMLIGAMWFGCFSTLWTSLTFLLVGAPFHYGNAVIGLFGLAGLAGAGAASIAALDLGVQGLHISNQSAIYVLAPEARSRLTTAYMVACFAGGALLSALSSLLCAAQGWYGVCILGAAAALVALTVWALTETRVSEPYGPGNRSRMIAVEVNGTAVIEVRRR